MIRPTQPEESANRNHLENALSENDSRPLPQNATRIHLPILSPPYFA